MEAKTESQQILTRFAESTYIPTWIHSFLIDRKSRGNTPGTIKFYSENLQQFARYCESKAISEVTQITAVDLREYLLFLESNGHNPGGCHMAYRCIRAFLRWYESEAEPLNWKNPIKKVPAPRLPQEPLEPVSLQTVKVLLGTCNIQELIGARDQAILLTLLDTGCRAKELLAINYNDIDLTSGVILIRSGKGRKSRNVFLGKATRKALRSYLRYRTDNDEALFIAETKTRLTYGGLRAIITRRAAIGNIEPPSIHDFRRGFAINCLRNGVDVVSVSRLLGHTSLTMTTRYLKQTTDDLAEAHRRGSPVDNSGL